jgi:hypothetical protein
MGILGGAIEALNISDLNRLCADDIPEGTEVEYKSALPVKTGRGLDAWHKDGGIGEYARNEIAEEIIAFANTFGGVLCLGIQESSDHPKRAAGLQPLPRVHDLARRLRQAVYDIIDPPLPMLEAIGIVSDEAGQGVVVMRVPPSRRKPHRHNVSKEVFYRRADETVRISMREVQELTVQALTEATRLETVIADRRRHHREAAARWINAPKEEGTGWGVAVQYLAVPATAIDLGRVVGRPRLTELDSIVVATMPGKAIRLKWSHLPDTGWRPGLRSISNVNKNSSTRRADYALYADGRCEVSCFFSLTQTVPFVAAGWLVGGLGVALSWIDRIRGEAGAAGEYVVASELSVFGKPASLMGYTDGNPDDYATLPVGHCDLPLMSVGASAEGDLLLQRFNEDIWNLAGRDVQSDSPKFSMP